MDRRLLLLRAGDRHEGGVPDAAQGGGLARTAVCPRTAATRRTPKLTKRQEDLWTIVEEWRELLLQELVRLAGTTSATIRKLEDKGW